MKRKVSSSLNRQRITRRATRRVRVGFKAVGLFVFAAVTLYGWRNFKSIDISISSPNRLSPSQLTIRTDSKDPLTAEELSHIENVCKENLRLSKSTSLINTAKQIQNSLDFALVRLTALADDKITIFVKRRNPVFTIEADALRLLSDDNMVYGKATEVQSTTLPRLVGFFEGRRDFAQKNDATLSLSSQEATLLEQAAALFLQTKKLNIPIGQIRYQLHRGFQILLTDSETEIVLGLTPFEDKLSRLTTIIHDLRAKGIQAQKIELDYEGKAFIKEKKT